MLAEALKVVEAARALDPYPGRAGIYRMSCEPRLVPIRLRELSSAIEGFDKSTSRGADAEAVLGRVIRYAARKGIDVRAMMAEITGEEEALDAEADEDLTPKPGEVGAPDTAQDITVSRQAAKDGAPVSGKAPQLGAKYTHDKYFPGQKAPQAERASDTSRPLDPTQSPERAPAAAPAPRPEDPAPKPESDMPKMKLAEHRLEMIAAKIGWTPELMKIDAALRSAKDGMTQATSQEGTAHLMNGGAERALGLIETALGKAESLAGDDDEDIRSMSPF